MARHRSFLTFIGFAAAFAGCKNSSSTSTSTSSPTTSYGPIVCWGLAQSGQLGDGTGQGNDTLVSVKPPISDATRLYAASSTSCALRASGKWDCWGGHTPSLFGSNSTSHDSPGPISVVPDAKELALGSLHACALRPSGEVVCWGMNLVGQLGNGQAPDPNAKIAMEVSTKDGVKVVGKLPNTANSDTPVSVTGLSDAVQIAAGNSHTCARRRDNTVVCWGVNSMGQIGDGKQGPSATSDHPVVIEGITDATSIFVGGNAACARRAAGGIWCWGSFSPKYPRDGAAPVIEARPVAIAGLEDAVEVAISTDEGGACARRASGEVLCWTAGKPPVPLTGLGNAEQIVAGMAHYCARLATGEVTCWGDNMSGVLGISSTDRKSTYQPIPDLTHVVDIAAGARHNCARRAGY